MVCKEVSSIFSKFYPRKSEKNKAKLLVVFIKDGGLVIVDQIVLRRSSSGLVKKNSLLFKKRGLNMDDHTGNFRTVEILRAVQRVGYYERVVFQIKSEISRKALKSEA